MRTKGQIMNMAHWMYSSSRHLITHPRTGDVSFIQWRHIPNSLSERCWGTWLPEDLTDDEVVMLQRGVMTLVTDIITNHLNFNEGDIALDASFIHRIDRRHLEEGKYFSAASEPIFVHPQFLVPASGSSVK